MKISSGSSVKSPASSKARSRSAAGFEVAANAPARQTEAAAGAGSTVALSALLALQSADADGRAKRKRSANRAIELLDALRQELLAGEISPSGLDALERIVNAELSQRDDDPALQAVYDDIVLRSRIELAKRGR